MTSLPLPALCGSYRTGLDPNEWVAEPKLDGMRLLLHITRDGVHAYGRADSFTGAGSRDGYLMALEDELAPLLAEYDDTVLDGEAVIVNGKPDFNATMRVMGSGRERAREQQRVSGKHVSLACFDVVRLKGVDTRHLPYDDRHMLLETLVRDLGVAHLFVNPSMVVADMGGFDAAYERMIELVGEGAVYKRRTSRYVSDRSDDWMKRKAIFDADVVITGWEPAKPGKFAGLVGAVKFSQYRDGVLVERGQCSGMTDAQRRDLTEHFDQYEGRVLVVVHNGFAPGGTAFRHPQWRYVRDDKRAEQCTWDEVPGVAR